MKKLTKQQLEALTNKISKEYSKLREELIEKSLPKVKFTKEEEAILQLAKECDKLKEKRDKLLETIKDRLNKIDIITSYYYQLEGPSVKKSITNSKLAKKYPVLTTDEIREELLLRSIGDDFDLDTLILEYLNRLKNE